MERPPSPSGRLVHCPTGYDAFVPASLPPEIGWTPKLLRALSDADRLIGQLAGAGHVAHRSDVHSSRSPAATTAGAAKAATARKARGAKARPSPEQQMPGGVAHRARAGALKGHADPESAIPMNDEAQMAKF